MRARIFSSINILLFSAFLLYCAISLVNHWCFRTYALDLGAYTAALYDYAHFQSHDCLSFKNESENMLAGHFDLYLPLISPLSWIFGNYTLLLIQIAAILFGGYGVYRLFKHQNQTTAVLATIYFFTSFGMLSAASYDYHSTVVAACLFPWLFLSVKQSSVKRFFIFFALIILAQENLSLIMLFVLPCLFFIEKQMHPNLRKAIFICIGISALYFLLITTVVMPGLSNNSKLNQFRYAVLGTDYMDAMSNAISHPIEYTRLLFVNHSGNPEFDYIKTEFWIFLGLCGGILLLFNWPFLVMLLPVMAQKLYHDQPEIWGINDHYSAELTPLLTIGIFYTLQKREWMRQRIRIWQYAVLVLSLGLTIRMMDNPTSLVRRDNIRLYNGLHYTSNINREAFKEAKALIPSDAAVCAQSPIHPHLAWRNNIYLFPFNYKKADYIFLFRLRDFWPLPTIAEFHWFIELLERNPQWKIIYDKHDLLLFKRK